MPATADAASPVITPSLMLKSSQAAAPPGSVAHHEDVLLQVSSASTNRGTPAAAAAPWPWWHKSVHHPPVSGDKSALLELMAGVGRPSYIYAACGVYCMDSGVCVGEDESRHAGRRRRLIWGMFSSAILFFRQLRVNRHVIWSQLDEAAIVRAAHVSVSAQQGLLPQASHWT